LIDLGVELRGWGRKRVKGVLGNLFTSLTGNRHLSGTKSIKDASKLVDVTAMINLPGQHHLRCHVPRRPDDLSGHGQAHLSQGLHQSKIQQDRPSPLTEHDISWLEIPVNEFPGVDVFQGPGHLLDPIYGIMDIHGTGLDDLLEALSRDILHDKIERPVRLSVIVHMDDIGMIQGGVDLHLPEETLLRVVGGGELRLEDLDRHLPVPVKIPGKVNLPHPTSTESLLDLVLEHACPENRSLPGT
jgi:hypothetical protein